MALLWVEKKRGDDGQNFFKRGGRDRNSCSPEICVDNLNVRGESYVVVLSAYLLAALVIEFQPRARSESFSIVRCTIPTQQSWWNTDLSLTRGSL